ncbi:hypothetical protein SAMN05444722_3219 [Rhodovulum sp. ES.010]|uniref:hypothetical protein n=1 Tax=Rhodovulum sp. ES.010 TaxID=1882821 RepID=UPI00092B840F|nr:hypothetical protein [Rhodovulum sp. ES.010]SIO53459.1 hypothetical protein SAMN05444722_3219 [Rhodovulum sp. ES.010]
MAMASDPPADPHGDGDRADGTGKTLGSILESLRAFGDSPAMLTQEDDGVTALSYLDLAA